MFKIRSNFKETPSLDGPPFSIIVKEKSKNRLRTFYVTSIIVIILHLIYRYSVVDTGLLKIDFFIFLFFIPASYLLLDNFIIIEGDHGAWTISKVKKFGKRGIIHQMVHVDKFFVELNVVSNFGNSSSLIVLKNKILDMKIKTINFKAKEFQDECEIINIHVLINKRGKPSHD